MNEVRRKASEFIQKEIQDMEAEVARGLDKIKADGAISSLEWNRLEDLADLELRVRSLAGIYYVLTHEEKHKDEQLVEVFNEWKKRTIEDLVVDSFCGGSISGPWDRRSTSVGSNRLAIVQANVKRYEIRELKRVIKLLEQ